LPSFNNEDNFVKYWPFNVVWLLLYIFLICGCASQIPLEDLSRDRITRPLSELKQEMKRPNSYASKIGWKETTYPLTNGNFVYIEPVSADCFMHWEINNSGIIIGYQSKEKYCKKREEPNNSIINTKSRK